MKYKLLFFAIFASLCIFSLPVKAETISIEPANTREIVINSDLKIKIDKFDSSSNYLVAEYEIDPSNNVIKLGFYPQKAKISWQIVASHVWQQSSDQANWSDISKAMSMNKLYLRPSSVLSVVPQEVVEKLKSGNDFSSADKNLRLKTNSQVTVTKIFPPSLENGDKKIGSDFYQIDSMIDDNDYDLSFFYKLDDFSSKNIYLYNQELQSWDMISGYNDVKEKFITASLRDQGQSIILAVFADSQAHDGIASYYNQSRYKYFNYKNGDFAASRDYPKGTKLKVARLKTGKSIIVTVNDYGPELKTNRVIDLDTYAFEQLSSLGAGLIYVKVEPYDQSK